MRAVPLKTTSVFVHISIFFNLSFRFLNQTRQNSALPARMDSTVSRVLYCWPHRSVPLHGPSLEGFPRLASIQLLDEDKSFGVFYVKNIILWCTKMPRRKRLRFWTEEDIDWAMRDVVCRIHQVHHKNGCRYKSNHSKIAPSCLVLSHLHFQRPTVGVS